MNTFRLRVYAFAACAASSSGSVAFAQAPVLTLQSTRSQCDLLGLGAIGSVPFNFPGAGPDEVVEARALNPGIVESRLPAGGNATAPAIWGGDLGAPFAHGDGKLYFIFGDSWFEGVIRTSTLPSTEGRPAIPGAPLNDDLLASLDAKALEQNPACLSLEFPRTAATGQIAPITWNGPANQGGLALGAGTVPGPGFSTGKYMFMLAPLGSLTCGETDGRCEVANGLATDVCKVSFDQVERCYYGDCEANNPSSPCALRPLPSQLLVRRTGTDFIEPEVGVHIEAASVVEAYRVHFATVSFYSDVDFATGDGSVWVVGRDAYAGTPGLTMSPYLMVHPVTAGVLDRPKYFAGMADEAPRWSRNALDAKPLYAEDKIVNNHTSIVFEPALNGGTWLMLYGGHAQPALRSLVAQFCSPVDDALFYDRAGGVFLRTAKQPWGPWSEPIEIFNAFQPGQGGYCENMYFEDPANVTQFSCPQDKVEHNAALNRSPGIGMGGEYGAALVPHFSTTDGSTVTLHWLLSTWNPYRVLQFESVLSIPQP